MVFLQQRSQYRCLDLITFSLINLENNLQTLLYSPPTLSGFFHRSSFVPTRDDT